MLNTKERVSPKHNSNFKINWDKRVRYRMLSLILFSRSHLCLFSLALKLIALIFVLLLNPEAVIPSPGSRINHGFFGDVVVLPVIL